MILVLSPDKWGDLCVLLMVRLMDPVPLKSVKDIWEKLYFSTEIQVHLSSNTLTDVLRDTGSDVEAQMNMFQLFIT
jgi:hypothetical protein